MKKTVYELLRFGVVGVVSNLIVFVLYLMLSGAGMGPKVAMTVTYFLGVVQTFVLNKRWTFSHHGHLSATFVRYVGLYATGYLINFGALLVLVDNLGYQHEWVQGIMIWIIAVLLFVAQKLWVFRVRAHGS